MQIFPKINVNNYYIKDSKSSQEYLFLEAIDDLLDRKFMPKRRDNERIAALMDKVSLDFKKAYLDLYSDILEQRCLEKSWNFTEIWWKWRQKISNRAQGLRDCGTYLEFGWHQAENKTRLQYANFCKGRVCPMCGWRRSLKLFGQLSRVVDRIVADGYSFIFMTLTVKNVPLEKLSGAIDEMMSAFRKLFQRKSLPSSQGKKGAPNPVYELSQGFFRSLEITINDRGECHPHFHVLVAVDSDYFISDKFLKTEELSKIWGIFLGVDYNPVVDLRTPKIYGDLESGDSIQVDRSMLKKAVSEVAKYTVKSNDIIKKLPGEEAIKRCLFGLEFALYNRRLVAFSGIFKKWHDLLNLSDAEEINEGDEMFNQTMADLIVRCHWKGIGWVKEIYRPEIDGNEF